MITKRVLNMITNRKIIVILSILLTGKISGNLFGSAPAFLNVLDQMVQKDISIQKAKKDLELTDIEILNKKLQFLPSASSSVGLSENNTSTHGQTLKATLGPKLNIYRFGFDSLNLKKAKLSKHYHQQKLKNFILEAEKEKGTLIINYLSLASSININKEKKKEIRDGIKK